MPSIRVLITRDGKITIEGIGYVGKQCLTDLKRLQELLQGFGVHTDIEQQQLKPEAHQSVVREEVAEE